jgi:hypothetical protein
LDDQGNCPEGYYQTEKTQGIATMEATTLVAQALEILKSELDTDNDWIDIVSKSIPILEQALEKLLSAK